jgi:vacuolar protein-sorting-associated protein 4
MEDGVRKLTPCSPGDRDAIEMTWVDVKGDELVLPNLAYKDFVKAVKSARPTVNAEDNQRHIQFTEDFGSEGR